MARTATAEARLADVSSPDFGMPVTEPQLPPSLHADRIEQLRSAMLGAEGLGLGSRVGVAGWKTYASRGRIDRAVTIAG